MDNSLEKYSFIGTVNDLEPTVSALIRVYEKLAHCRYEKQCAVLKLGLENLAPILMYLGTEDRTSARLTCRAFKDCIDNYVGVHVNLDYRKINSMQEFSIPPPGASSIRLWGINHSKYLDHLLNRPLLTTEVIFTGQVTLSAFTKIVSRCMNLKKISFTDRSHLYANIVPMQMNNLHTLDLGCPGNDSDYVGEYAVVPSLWLTYEILLRRLIVPNLKVLRVYFCCVEQCSVLHDAIAQIFRFLAVHSKVTDLSINLHHRYEKFNFLEGDVNYRRFRIEVPKKILRRIQFHKLHIETMEPAFKVWDSILPRQKALTHMDILNKGRRWFYFSKIISNNFATLQSIRLHNISPQRTKTVVLNAGIFKDCQVLETLFLSRFENSTQEIVYCYPSENSEFPFLDTETAKSPEMENLAELPVTLKKLHLQGLVLSSFELCNGIPRLNNLEVLEIQFAGYHNSPGLKYGNSFEELLKCTHGKGLGVTGQVIQSIVQHCRKLEILFIEEFENEWTTIRDSGLGDKICKISHIPGDGYFEDGEFYGLLICSNVPQSSGSLTRSERMHLWGVRINQYFCSHDRKRKNNRKNETTTNVDDGSNKVFDLFDDQDVTACKSAEEVQELSSSTSLLELLDKENGQLKQIQRLLSSGRTPPPATPTKMRAECTQRIAQVYSDTLFCAIPNYHKASRLQLDPTEKFASFFPRPRSKPAQRSRPNSQSAINFKKMQNYEKLLKQEHLNKR